jgi:hypothetical protein
MPSRDYLLRLIEQVAQLLARAVHQRKASSPQESLQSIMAACERLFGLEAVQIFQFTPDQHMAMLTEGETPGNARNKILIYAALNLEAGRNYTALGQPQLAQQTFLNALRLTLRARSQYPADLWPDYAPNIAELLKLLGDTPLDSDTATLLAENRPS